MDVFDVNGRRITQLMDDEQPAGCYQVQLDGSSLASGVYFYRIEATGAGHHFMDIRKMMMIK